MQADIKKFLKFLNNDIQCGSIFYLENINYVGI